MSIVSESFQVVKQLLISEVEKGWFEQNFPGRQLWAAMGLAREVSIRAYNGARAEGRSRARI